MEVNEFSMAYMWRSEDNLQESVLYWHHVGPGEGTGH